jgi:dolichol kinase
MNVRVFGVVILAAGIIILAIGGFLWVTGVPDDGQYHVQADNVLDLIAKNRARIERRQQSRTPLLVGGIAFVIGGALVIAARSTG